MAEKPEGRPAGRVTLFARSAGLGDQIIQHRLACALAGLLGARYVQSPIPAYRMWPGVGEFTGIDLYPEPAEGERIRVKLSDLLDAEGNVTAPDSARTALDAGELLEVAYEYLPAPRLLVLNRAASAAPFPFRSLYEQVRRRRGHLAPRDRRRRVVVHLRLGDRAVEPLPDGRLYYRYGGEIMATAPDVPPRLPVFAQWQELRRLLDDLSGAGLEVILLTDGYARFMKFVRMDAKHIGLPPEHIPGIEQRLQERLKAFASGAAFRVVVGEEEEKTCFAIDALADADAVVTTAGTFAAQIAREFGGLPTDRIFKLDALLTDGPGLVHAALAQAERRKEAA
jgi:hypothetical protein